MEKVLAPQYSAGQVQARAAIILLLDNYILVIAETQPWSRAAARISFRLYSKVSMENKIKF